MTGTAAQLSVGVLKDAIDKGAQQLLAHLQDRKLLAVPERLAKRFRELRMVKTLWHIDNPVDLVEFYHPVRIQHRHSRLIVDEVESFPWPGNVLVEGVVGQGKTIFLRYLASRELAKGKRLPLFSELRDLQDAQALEDFLAQELANWGLPGDETTLTHLAEHGKLILFLDGFDELKPTRFAETTKTLEHLSKRYPKLRIVASSRPDRPIKFSEHFSAARLAPLEGSEYLEVLRRIASDSHIASEIAEGVQRAGPQLRELLDSPLMVSLLVFRYNADQSIPQNVVAFFSQLLDLLLRRHDRSKKGYERPRRSGLGDSALHELFDWICFFAKQGHKLSSPRTELDSLAAKALRRIGRDKIDPSALAQDLIDITCLILEEGGDCRFVHKSIVEFHSARCVSRFPETLAKGFYRRMGSRWRDWEVELTFLEELDRYRFLRWFAIDEMREVLGIGEDDAPSEFPGVSAEHIADLLGSTHLLFSRGPEFDLEQVATSLDYWYLSQLFDDYVDFAGLHGPRVASCVDDGEVVAVRSRRPDSLDPVEVCLIDLLATSEFREEVTNELEGLFREVHHRLVAAIAEVERRESILFLDDSWDE